MNPKCHPGALCRIVGVPGVWQVWSLAPNASRYVLPWNLEAQDWQATTPGHTVGCCETIPARKLCNLQEAI
jgi:hypothetical protein